MGITDFIAISRFSRDQNADFEDVLQTSVVGEEE
jgi:hypothetical protein